MEGPLSLKLLDVLTIILNYSVSQAIDVKSGESSTMLIDLIASLAFFSVNNRRHQDLLISEQFAVIFKSLAKLSSQFNPVIYPFLVTMCYNNAPARQLISRDFDLGVSKVHSIFPIESIHSICIYSYLSCCSSSTSTANRMRPSGIV